MNEWMNTPYSFLLFFDSMWQRIGGSIYQGNSNSIMQLNPLLTYTHTRITHHWSLTHSQTPSLQRVSYGGVPANAKLASREKEKRTQQRKLVLHFPREQFSPYCTVSRSCSSFFFCLLKPQEKRKTSLGFVSFSAVLPLWEETKAKKKIQESW